MKHNMHHALTNEIGYDEDIALEPFIYLWRPDPQNDSKLRKLQHWLWPIPFSILFLYWRVDSVRYAAKFNKKMEGLRLAMHYAIFGSILPLPIFFLAVWLSGFLTATIVTVTHQSEDLYMGETSRSKDWVEAQFSTTRDASLTNWFSDVLWGGMQWQLEHHLFPTMPRYRYKKLAPRMKQFAEENGLTYRVSGEVEIIKANVLTLSQMASQPPQAGNPSSEPAFKQI